MVQEMLSFFEGRFGGQSSVGGWGETWKLEHNPSVHGFFFLGEKGMLVALSARI